MLFAIGFGALLTFFGLGVDGQKIEFDKEYSNKVSLRNGEYLYLKWKFQETGSPARMEYDVCQRRCQGGKHATHDRCDESCDFRCNHFDQHYRNLVPKFYPRGEDGRVQSQADFLRRMGTVLTRERLPFTADHVFGSMQAMLNGRYNFEEFKSVNLTQKCWNTQHCSTSQGWAEAVEIGVTIDYQFASDPDWGGPQPEEMGGKGAIRYFIVLPKPKFHSADRSTPACRCEPPAPPEPPKETGMIPGGFVGDGEHAYVEEGGKKRVITGQELASVVKSISCNDMNSAVITVAALPGAKVVVPAGWELQCIEGNGQDVQLQEDLEVASASLLANLKPLLPTQESQKTVRTLCLDINAPEPKPSMKYRLVPPRNPLLTRLARITRGSSFKGPLDQVRLWIATDYASHASIAKVLLPPPREAQYLRELYRAASVDAVNPFDPRAQNLLEDRFALAEGGDPSALRWFVDTKLASGSVTFIPWLEQQRDLVAKLFTAGPPEADIAHLSAICGTLARSGRLDAVRAAISVVRAVPIEHRAEMYKAYGTLEIGQVLGYTKDESLATMLLDWLESDKPPFAGGMGANINSALPDSIKSRAKALYTVKLAN